MILFEKIKTTHSFIFSAIFHLLIVAVLLNIFNKDSNLNFVSNIQPVAVISGSEFEIIKSQFSKKNKKSAITRLDNSSDIALSQSNKKEQRKGNKYSTSNNGIDFSVKNSQSQNNSYANIIANKLEQNKSYISMSSAPSRVKTKVMLKVKLDKNGGLDSYKIVQNSDYNFFNKAAIKILEISAPFPKPPLTESLEFTIPILFDTV